MSVRVNRGRRVEPSHPLFRVGISVSYSISQYNASGILLHCSDVPKSTVPKGSQCTVLMSTMHLAHPVSSMEMYSCGAVEWTIILDLAPPVSSFKQYPPSIASSNRQ